MSELGVGVLGVGFMGQTHVRAYQRAARLGAGCRLVAVADGDASRRRGEAGPGGNIDTGGDARLFDAGEVAGYATAAELLADEAVQAVSVCMPTDMHAEIAVAALEAGKHVLVEKPVAITRGEVERVMDAAAASGRVCMPAMCIRFWPGYTWLKDRVVDGSLGALRSVAFTRRGTRPSWGGDFYLDPARCGGALFDLHIHDSDFVFHLLGMPERVSSVGTIDHLTTLYRFADRDLHVTAEGGWDHAAGFAFQMRYVAVFEDATAELDMGRAEPLVVSRNGESAAVAIEDWNGYEGEVQHFVDVLQGRVGAPGATLEEALRVVGLLEAERESLQTGESVAL